MSYIISSGLIYWQGLVFGILFLTLVGLIYWKLFHSNVASTDHEVFTKSEDWFRFAFDYSSIGIALLSEKGNFLQFNNALCNVLGYSKKELLKTNIQHIAHSDEAENFNYFLKEMLEDKLKIYQKDQRYIHKNGDIIWVRMNFSMIRMKKNSYFIAQFQNITNEKQAEEQLRHLAYHDPLTGLANRNRFEEQMQEILAFARRHRSGFALVMLDLDHFKIINDTIGHDAGDLLLQIIAERVKSAVRMTDIIARVGGDEFVVVITDITKVDSIANIVQKILDSLLKPILIKGHEIYITTSIGISVYPYDGHDLQILMKNADLALYRSKELGRNNYQFCTPEMTAKAREKMARQNALAQALAKNEFFLHYQPKLDLINWRINGVEALLRWESQQYGIVSPDEIISLAEEAGLIVPLSEWVLNTACKQAKIWQKMGIPILTISVNLSARQFKQAHFTEQMLKILFDNQFPPELLELEITESLIMQDPDHILRVLHVLKQNGIRIAIDDFGTGYSSMDYLKRFSIDKIKIDKTFIHRISEDPTYAAIVTAMIAMANKLGIKTVAEGVETKEQFRFLLAEKCSEVQGYLFTPPLSPQAATDFLRKPEMITTLADFH